MKPAEIKLIEHEADSAYPWIEFCIDNVMVATLEKRPPYCDRGRFYVKCFLPDIDSADGFPRYYMNETNAKLETIAWLNWRLWRKSVS